jgi:GDP-L-fucose synthase
MMNKNVKIYIAGHKGMVGSAIHRKLLGEGYSNIVTRTLQELDLTRQIEVEQFFQTEKPEYVILAAAKVGGIVANNVYRGEFIYQNLMIQNNVIHQSYVNGVKKLIFLGSSCIYPKMAPQPISEDYLLSSELEQTNEPYAIAKIAGLKLCESYDRQYGTNFFSLMPCNMFGPNDNFDLTHSHVLSALLRKMHLGKLLEENNWDGISKDLNRYPINGVDGNASKESIIAALDHVGVHLYPDPYIEIWGTGQVLREFLYVDDLADATCYLLENFDLTKADNPAEHAQYFFNIGSGKDLSINALALLIKKVTGFSGNFWYDQSKPDGTYRKLLDVSRINAIGWKYSTELEDGIRKMYAWYCAGEVNRE